MADGWPIFAEWAARDAEVKALPHYGGNNIPDAYLDRFNAETDAWLKRIGARKEGTPLDPGVPDGIANFVELL